MFIRQLNDLLATESCRQHTQRKFGWGAFFRFQLRIQCCTELDYAHAIV